MIDLKNKKRIPLSIQENKDVVDPESLLNIQTKSFQYFMEKGVGEELKNISPIVAYGGKYELEFLDDFHFEAPEHSFEECQLREITYCAPLRVSVRLTSKESGEVTEQEVFLSLFSQIPDCQSNLRMSRITKMFDLFSVFYICTHLCTSPE